MRVGRDHRNTLREQHLQALPDEGLPMPFSDHVGRSNELVHAPRPGRQMVERMIASAVDGVILHVG
jgi:hypothetical protein